MNLYQSMNASAFFLIVVALLNGIKGKIILVHSSPLEFLKGNDDLILFMFFYIILRAKITFDDHKHFSKPEQDVGFSSALGFLLAIISWVIWGLSGYVTENISLTFDLLAGSLFVSTMWIFIHIGRLVKKEKEKKTDQLGSELTRNIALRELRGKWVCFNLVYIFLLHLCAMGNEHDRNFTTGILWIALAILVLDIFHSKSFSGVLDTGKYQYGK